jgi:hypothetical protein
MNITKLVQNAREVGKFAYARVDGKLTYFKPPVGACVVFEDGDHGSVLRSPNTIGDFTVKLTTGETIRANVKNDTIIGYILK